LECAEEGGSKRSSFGYIAVTESAGVLFVLGGATERAAEKNME
jgi:hypothetical protein